jgi:beta-glucanase (GH16 family)
MKKLFILLALGLLFIGVKSSHAALTWADEFNSISGWSFQIGGGGYGNGELEYYRSQNATVSNGVLAITAKRESYGGYSYTSARMSKGNFLYGFFETKATIPMVQGMWPAFWMLGTNIGSVGWPACGEIDIMEHVNTGTDIHGSLHWNNGGQKDWTAIGYTSPGNSHYYQCNWNMYGFKFYIDGVQYGPWVGSASGNGMNDNGMGAFRKNFFILLNLAVGGYWPGNTIGNLPATFWVDYVRQYTAAAKNTDGTEAEPVFNADGSFNRFTNENPAPIAANITANMFPNPLSTDGTLNIQLSNYDVNSPVSIEIFNVNGQLVASRTEANGEIVLNSLNLRTGTYIVRLMNNSNVVTQKLIVK